MPEPLKNVFSKSFVQDLGQRLNSLENNVQVDVFTSRVLAKGWKDLELKARMSRISDTLHDFLGDDFARNARTLSQLAIDYRNTGRTGFEYMFLPEYIEKHGLNHFKTSMSSLASMTETGSAEFAIRPFLIEEETKTLRQMQTWAKSRDEHLRRLASEGCRPRLPWAMALPDYKKNPAPIIPILEALKGDPSLYVRRSVANNLNDVSKDHPELALDIAEKWHGDSEDTNWLVKHACRGLLKSGNPRALQLFGFAPPDKLKLSRLKLTNKTVQFGDKLEFSFQLTSPIQLGTLRLEYGIDFVKANGSLSRKVFKIGESRHEKNQLNVVKTHKFVPITTRVHYPGKHYLAIIVNGVELGKLPFLLEM